MTAITAEALEAALPKITKTTVVFHAYHEDADDGDIDELYTDLDLAKQHTAAVYAYEEYGHALISDGALAWEPLGNGWKLVDQGSDTGIVIVERHVFGTEAGAR